MEERWEYENIVRDLIAIGSEEEKILESLNDVGEALEHVEEIWRWIDDLSGIVDFGPSDMNYLHDRWSDLREAVEYEDFSVIEKAIEDFNEEIEKRVGWILYDEVNEARETEWR